MQAQAPGGSVTGAFCPPTRASPLAPAWTVGFAPPKFPAELIEPPGEARGVWVRRTRGRGLGAAACPSPSARAGWRTWSATGTSRSASASTSASGAAVPAPRIFATGLRDTVRAAYDIARFTAGDEFAGLPDAEDLALDAAHWPTLDLFHPWAIDAQDPLPRFALRCRRRVVDRQAHPPTAGRFGLCAAKPFGWATRRLSRQLCQFAAFAVGGANCWPKAAHGRDFWAQLRCATPPQLASPEPWAAAAR